jgi:Flp pilus assembly protein TadG
VHRRLNPRPDERGMVLVVVALAMVAILTIVAVVIDGGYARQEAQESQNATDAAALAGARELPTSNTAAIASALEIAVRDLGRTSTPQATSCVDPFPPTVGGQQTACYLVDGDYLEITANYAGTTRMRVESTQSSPAFLGGVADETGTAVTRAAVAMREPGGIAECGLCVLGTGTPFDGQNGDIVVTGQAGAAINGNADTKNNGCLAVENGSIVIHSGGDATGADNLGTGTNCDTYSQTAPTRVSFPLANPLEHLDALQPVAGAPVAGCAPGTHTSIPTTCQLQPGLHIITGNTHISGTEQIRGQGVTLFFTGSAGVTCTGQSEISITAPATSPGQGVPPGIAIWFASTNTGSFDCRGNGGGILQGTIYGKAATMQLRGNGACSAINSLVVVGRFEMDGNPSNCSIHYEANQNTEIPYGDPFLVE